MPQLEALSKRAAIVSVLAIVVLQQMLHPDATWLLRAMTSVALVAGWVSARSGGALALGCWLFLAPVAPAILKVLTGRQGEPLLDVVWMAGLAGFVIRTISWSRWTFPPLWSVLLGGWALTLALAWPVMALREIAFDPELLRDAGALNSWAEMSAPQVVTWTLYVVATQLLGVLWFDWVYGECARVGPPEGGPHVRRRVPRAVHGLWIGVTVASVVAIIQGTVDLTFLNTEFWAGERRAGGTMLNPNAYGVAAVCAGIVGFLALRWTAMRPETGLLFPLSPRRAVLAREAREETLATSRGAPRGYQGAEPLGWLNVTAAALVLAVNWAGVWMSGSRTAFLCWAAGALGAAAGMWRAREATFSPKLAVAGGIAAAALVVGALAGGAVGPLERLAEIPLTREGLARVRDRGTYTPIAHQIIREYPLTGVGVGAFHYLAPDYERVNRDEQLPFDNAQNWWRHQLAELGILGGAPVLLFSLSLGWVLIRGWRQDPNPADTWTARALVLGIAAVSLLGMPTQSPVVLLWFFLLVAMVSARSTGPVPALAPLWVRAGWLTVVGLAVAYAAGHLVLASGPLSVAERATRFRHEYVAGAYGPEPRGDGPMFRWTDDESRFVIPATSPWLILRLWAHHPDAAQHPVHVTISDACGVLFERDLDNTEVGVWFDLPADVDMLDFRVRVSRTWSPADFGAGDTRELGVAVLPEFQENRARADSQYYQVVWRSCPADLL